jgi:hypothetical protein
MAPTSKVKQCSRLQQPQMLSKSCFFSAFIDAEQTATKYAIKFCWRNLLQRLCNLDVICIITLLNQTPLLAKAGLVFGYRPNNLLSNEERLRRRCTDFTIGMQIDIKILLRSPSDWTDIISDCRGCKFPTPLWLVRVMQIFRPFATSRLPKSRF